jgi:hypothetical protein
VVIGIPILRKSYREQITSGQQNVSKSQKELLVTQILMVWSTDPDATVNSLYLFQSTASTSFGWAGIVRTEPGLLVSQILTVLSPEQETKLVGLWGLHIAL